MTMVANAHPMTAAEFGQLKAAPFGGSYQRYTNWWANTVAPKFAAKAGMPTGDGGQGGGGGQYGLPTPQQLQSYGRQMYPVQSDAQALQAARLAVQSAMDPAVKSITSAVQGQTDQGRAAIASLAHSFANNAAPIGNDLLAYDQKAVGQSAGVADALASVLRGNGGSLAQALGGAGPVDFNKVGNAAAQASLSGGEQNVQNLLGQGITDKRWGASLPGIAAGQGIMAAGNYEGQQTGKLTDALSQLQGQAPGMVSSLYGTMLGRSQTGREDRAALMIEGMKNAAMLQATQMGNDLTTRGQNQQNQQFWANPSNYTLPTPSAAASHPYVPPGTITPKDTANALAGAAASVMDPKAGFLPFNPALATPVGQQIINSLPKAARSDPYSYMLPRIEAALRTQLTGVNVKPAALKAQAIAILGSRGIVPIKHKALPPGGVGQVVHDPFAGLPTGG